MSQRIPPSAGVLEAVDKKKCVLQTGANSLETLAVYLGLAGVDFEIQDPPELIDQIRRLAARYDRAAKAGTATAVS